MNTENCIKHLTTVCTEKLALEKENAELKRKYNDLIELIEKMIPLSEPKKEGRTRLDGVTILPFKTDDIAKECYEQMEKGNIVYCYRKDMEIIYYYSESMEMYNRELSSHSRVRYHSGNPHPIKEIAQIGYTISIIEREKGTINLLRQKLANP